MACPSDRPAIDYQGSFIWLNSAGSAAESYWNLLPCNSLYFARWIGVARAGL